MGSADRHGTEYRYNKHKCRCQACRAAHANRQATNVAQRRAILEVDPSIRPHGNPSTYKNWGCRCDPCIDAGLKQRGESERRRRRGETPQVIADPFKKPYPPYRMRSRIKPFGREWINA